jgi:hypothetical protein
MAQPRKEQINDQRTFFTPINTVGYSHPVPFGTPDVSGGTIQTFQNNSNGNYYLDFLNLTVTGAAGGSESNAPAFFFGNNGPFSSPVIAGASFTITLPGVNNGNPVLITFQPSDSVNISSVPFITTSKCAARINAALTAAGVNPTTPVAANVNGQLVLTSANNSGYTTGVNAFITVNDVTIGICSALGFTSTNSAVSTGVSSPQRGIITTSDDGQGGYIQLRLLDGSPAITQSPIQLNVGGLGNLPLYPAGQRVYGRLQYFPGLSNNPKLVVSYYRQGAVPGNIITNGENCSSIVNTDSFTVTVKTTNPAVYPYMGLNTYTLNITFVTSPLGPQDVINAVNAAWNAAAVGAGFPSGTEAGRGGIAGTFAGPWYFDNNDEFFISFNGQTPIQISPGPATLSSQDLVTFINAQISVAGQTAQGQSALAANGSIQITSALTTGRGSTVQIYAGDDHDNTAKLTNSYVVTLDKIGITPGVYSGSVIAQLYGQDEIQFICPDHTISDPYGSSTSITVSGTSTVMAKLGLSGTSVTGNTSNGIEAISPTPMQALIPEMMNFGEIPENVETITGQFQEDGIPSPISAGTGTGNVGVSPLIGINGKINTDLISKIFPLLNIESLTLGAGDVGTTAGNATPRLITPFSNSQTIGLTLLWQASSIAGLDGANASQIIRLYIDQNGGLWLTNNASWLGSNGSNALTWNKDIQTQAATAFYIAQPNFLDSTFGPPGAPKVEFLYRKSTDTNPIVFGGPQNTSDNPPIGFDPTGSTGGSQAFIQVGSTDPTNGVVPHYMSTVNNSTYTLVWQSFIPGGGFPLIRMYAFTGGTESYYELTVNASWNGSDWQKDVNGQTANVIALIASNTNCSFDYRIRLPGNDTPWSDNSWDSFPFTSHLSDGNGLNAQGNSGTGSGVVGTGSNSGGNQGAGLIGVGGGGTAPIYANYNGVGVWGQGGSGNNNGIIGQGTGSGSGVVALGGPSATSALFAQAAGEGSGVVALAGNTGGQGAGIIGVGGGGSNPSYADFNGAGVFGQGGSGNNNGVIGQGVGSGPGTVGIGGATSFFGVLGQVASGSTGVGVGGLGDGASFPSNLTENHNSGVTGYGGPDGVGVFGFGGSNAPGVTGFGGSGNTAGVSGIGSGTGAGGAFQADSAGSGPGVTGQGISGGAGVVGNADGRAGLGIGVQGIGQGTGNSGAGVNGIAMGTNAPGVWGTGIGTGQGVIGEGGVNGDGGYFAAGGGNAYGVHAFGAGTSNGIMATGGSTGNTGDGNSDSAGVYGLGGGGNAYGVYGLGVGNAAGVYGKSDTAGAPGGEFQAGSGGSGIIAKTSGNGVGVTGTGSGSGSGGNFTGGGSGAGAYGTAGTGSGSVGFWGQGDGGGDGIVGVGGSSGGDGGHFTGQTTGNGANFDVNNGSGWNSSVWNHSLSGNVGRPLAVNANTGPIHVDTPQYNNSDGNPGKNNIWQDNIVQCHATITSNGDGTSGVNFIGPGTYYGLGTQVLAEPDGFSITLANAMHADNYTVICQNAFEPTSPSTQYMTAAQAQNSGFIYIYVNGVNPQNTSVTVNFLIIGPS